MWWNSRLESQPLKLSARDRAMEMPVNIAETPVVFLSIQVFHGILTSEVHIVFNAGKDLVKIGLGGLILAKPLK